MTLKLAIGIATFDDFPGCEMTLTALRTSHDLTDTEIVIIDNNPDSAQGKKTKILAAKMHDHPCPVKYVEMPNPQGTSPPRDRIFYETEADSVLVMDSHVIVPTFRRSVAFHASQPFKQFREMLEKDPDCRDIFSGPMLDYGLETYATHFADQWRDQMWGTWGVAWQCPCGGFSFDLDEIAEPAYSDGVVSANPNTICRYHRMEMGWEVVDSCPACGLKFPVVSWVEHEKILRSKGFRRLDEQPYPFEVPGMGLGLFGCRRDAWQGFHPLSKGFGGEELYIHEKFRRAGGRAVCLPWLPWWHRFGRPCDLRTDTPPYPLILWDKVRNYVLEFTEIGRPLDGIRKEFVPHHLSEEFWNYLIEDPVSRKDWPGSIRRIQALTGRINPPAKKSGRPQPPEGSSIDEIFTWACTEGQGARDLEQHFPMLKQLTENVEHVTAFVKRREVAIPLVAGRASDVIVFCTEQDEELQDTLHGIVSRMNEPRRVRTFTTDFRGSQDVPAIEQTDMLILAQVHTRSRVLEELGKFAGSVNRWIVLQGTGAFGEVGEDQQQPGLLVGAREFMLYHPEWHRVFHTDVQYGITVLSKDPFERTIDRGPGFELHVILEEKMKIVPPADCSCRTRARQMDVWGVEGCREHFDEIVGWMKETSVKFDWVDKMNAAKNALLSGVAFQISWADPWPDLIKMAIDNAEAKDIAWEQFLRDNGR